MERVLHFTCDQASFLHSPENEKQSVRGSVIRDLEKGEEESEEDDTGDKREASLGGRGVASGKNN